MPSFVTSTPFLAVTGVIILILLIAFVASRYKVASANEALIAFLADSVAGAKRSNRQDAEEFFQKEGYQPRPVAKSETKRGTSDATYGYYTMGKLMILKLRDDYKAKTGAQYSLQNFHDTFISVGPLPLPLVRKAMLGEVGQLF